jgi:membrane protein
MIVLVSILPYLNLDPSAITEVLNIYLPQEIAAIFETLLEPIFTTTSPLALSTGLVLALWSASTGIFVILKSINKISCNHFSRGYFKMRLLSIFLTIFYIIFTGVFLGLAFLNFGLPGYFKELSVYINSLWNLIFYLIFPIFVFLSLLVLYRISPGIKYKWKHIFPGTIFAFISLLVVTYGFNFYVLNIANYGQFYQGTMSSIIIILFWFLYLSLALLSGALINSILHDHDQDLLEKDIYGHKQKK